MQRNKKARKHSFVLIMLWMLLAVCPAYCNTYYVDPNGSNGNPGDIDHPYQTINKGVSMAAAGDTVYVRAGTYTYSGSALTLSTKSGSSPTNRPKLFSYQNERPLVDLSAMGTGSTNGIRINGNYWYIKGIDFRGAPNNGIAITGGSYNIIEFCRAYENRDSGVQLGNGASYNQIINCDSYYNYDPDTGGQNADGFSPKMDVGTGDYFYGCRSWQNSDDGYDGYLRGSDNVDVTYENCWAFKNGYLKDANSTVHGNGNGFKMGGSDDKTLRHNVTLINCLSFLNLVKGFDQNNNRGSMTLYNCTAYNNGGNNYYFSNSEPLADGKTATVANCVYFTGTISLADFVVQMTNSWLSPFVVTSDDFNSIDPSAAYGPRNADGSLPDITFMHPVVGSDLIDGGTNVWLPYCGSAPDLGYFEYCTGIYPGVASNPTPASGTTGVSNTQTLSWTAGANTTSHDVYFGPYIYPPFIGNQTGTTYDTGTMVQGITYYWRITENNTDCTTPGVVWSFTTAPPPPPGPATDPTPTNGATGVSQTQDLSWTAGSGIVDSYNVYFGTAASPPLVLSHQLSTSYGDTGTMVPGITYYWRIDENNLGGTTTGAVWHFTIAPPPLPGPASNLIPADGAINVSQTQDLLWTAGSGIVDSHDVYFGTAASPPLVSSHQTATSYDTGIMTQGTTYYWHIDENNLGGTTTGAVQSFTTTAQQNVIIIGSWVKGTTHAKETGTNRGLIFIAHAKQTSSPDPNLTAVKYGGQSMTRIITKLQGSGTSNTPYVAAFYLNEAGIAAATNTTFTPTWTNLPTYVDYTSAFVENVNQTTSIGATDSNGTGTGTGATIGASPPLTTTAGDIVIEASATTSSSAGTYTANNGFTKDFDNSNSSFDAMDGHKTATGVPETPSVTHSINSNVKVLIGFVVKDMVASPPDAASNPSPSAGATNVSLTQDLSWTPGSGATSHDVYFGTAASPPQVSSSQTGTTYDTGTMTSLTTYYWRIDEENSSGTNTGPVWSFTTADTIPPTPNPMTWAHEPNTVNSSSITMTATTASDDSGVQYYFANITDSNHDSGWVSNSAWTDTGLTNNTKYFYKVKARDMSANHNETGLSLADANATTLVWNCAMSIASDLTGNCQVDFLDFVRLADAWAGNPPDVDLNGDNVLDLKDLAQFAADWLTCNRVPAGECWK